MCLPVHHEKLRGDPRTAFIKDAKPGAIYSTINGDDVWVYSDRSDGVLGVMWASSVVLLITNPNLLLVKRLDA